MGRRVHAVVRRGVSAEINVVNVPDKSVLPMAVSVFPATL